MIIQRQKRTTDTKGKLFAACPLESATKTRLERFHQRAWFTNIFSPLNFSYSPMCFFWRKERESSSLKSGVFLIGLSYTTVNITSLFLI